MSLKPTKIEWCTHSWNPVTGCLHGCEYCYARGIARRFCLNGWRSAEYGGAHWHGNPTRHRVLPDMTEDEAKRLPIDHFPYGFDPTFHVYRLNDPANRKKPARIFVCSMADLFGEWVPDSWIEEVFAACERAPQHNYMFLTKNPGRYMELAQRGLLPEGNNYWFGSTVTTCRDEFWWSNSHNSFLSIEPMHERFDCADPQAKKADWIIIGAESGSRKGKVTPKREWIEELCGAADAVGIPMFMKDSLLPIMGEADMRRELPLGLRDKT